MAPNLGGNFNKNFFVGSLGFPLSQGENVENGLIHPEMQVKKANLKFVRPFNPNLQGDMNLVTWVPTLTKTQEMSQNFSTV